MILASDVRERGGRVLLTAGTEVIERHLEIFKKWGVVEADIEGADQEEQPAEALETWPPDLVLAVEQEVRTQFQHNDSSHPAIKELLKLSVRQRLRNASRRGMQ
ncbi:MAG: hypothetical protein AB1898_12595 [Acidobacteriota bacterium]